MSRTCACGCGGALTGRSNARGLTGSCYDRLRRSGALADHPRVTRARDELLDDWTVALARVATRAEAADLLGVALPTLDRALQRARSAGDSRAVWRPRTSHPLSERIGLAQLRPIGRAS